MEDELALLKAEARLIRISLFDEAKNLELVGRREQLARAQLPADVFLCPRDKTQCSPERAICVDAAHRSLQRQVRFSCKMWDFRSSST
mmetsp:Transcript_5849/g.15568  ORF Transcript_5849/g.15568 Transcript_5849/m.15568 type:complete len:88 (-) Transcript_5849:541-804(-)